MQNRSDTALKIQFLRLIHNLTSHDEWDIGGKLLFISSDELALLL
ncbi:MAG: DUF3689 domain-containing protein [Candidatus Pacebacteria bacterium]|nr:DUF3689 domain-containing protein [Candidatus Paceibacterota bacterium]